MPPFDPQLINNLTQYFLRKGSLVSGSQLTDGSVPLTKLQEAVATQEDLAAIQTSIGDDVTNLTSTVSSLTTRVANNESGLGTAEARIDNLEGYSRFNVSAAALTSLTPGAEGWAYFTSTTNGVDYEPGVTINNNSTDSPASWDWVLADTDIFFFASVEDSGAGNTNSSVHLNVATDASGTGALELLQDYRDSNLSSATLSGFIPAGMYYNILTESNKTRLHKVYLFPMQARV